jgi:hypothetical protein
LKTAVGYNKLSNMQPGLAQRWCHMQAIKPVDDDASLCPAGRTSSCPVCSVFFLHAASILSLKIVSINAHDETRIIAVHILLQLFPPPTRNARRSRFNCAAFYVIPFHPFSAC